MIDDFITILLFIIILQTERFDNLIGFNLCSYRACKSLWKSCVEQHTFFRLHTPKPLTKKFFFFFSLGSKFRYSGKTEFQTIEENRRRLTRTERIFIRNTGRNATMPASSSIIKSSATPIITTNGNDQQQKTKIMDAQKHIVNLKLSTMDGGTTTTTTTAAVTNGCMMKERTSSTSNHHLQSQQQHQQQRKHSPTALSSMESTGSGSLSSSSASSLLGPSSSTNKKIIMMNEKKAKTLATTTAKNDNDLLTTTKSIITKSVLSSSSSSGHLIHNNNNHHHQKHLKKQSENTIINNNNTSHSNHHSQGFQFISSSSSSTSTSSIESSFMPLNPMDNVEQQQLVKLELENGTNDLNDQKVCCDKSAATITTSNNNMKILTKDNNKKLKIFNSNNDDDDDGKSIIDPSTTIITIGGSTVGDQAKISTTTFTTTTAFTPSTLISLPFIDSISTTSSDKTIGSLTNGTILGDDNNNKDAAAITETSQTSTITEDIQLPNDNDTDNEGNNSLMDKQQQPTFDFDLPIHELIEELYDDAAAAMPNNNNDDDDDGTINQSIIPDPSSDTDSPIHAVTVTMKPDEQGRFGFNVKGGHDQDCRVILVSRILPNTPADYAEPKLHEGDQVLAINGVEVSGLKHEQVVQLIRSTKDSGPEAKLVLSVLPIVCYKPCQCPNESIDTVDHNNHCDPRQSPFHYTPVNYSISSKTFHSEQQQSFSPSPFVDDVNPEESGDDDDDDDNGMKVEHTSGGGASLLDTSMNLLHEGLQGDLLIIQFEYLPRRNEDETITIARLLDNVPKNRYLDIAPCMYCL